MCTNNSAVNNANNLYSNYGSNALNTGLNTDVSTVPLNSLGDIGKDESAYQQSTPQAPQPTVSVPQRFTNMADSSTQQSANPNLGYVLTGLGTLVQSKAQNSYYDSLVNQLQANKGLAQQQIATTGYAGNVAANDARRQGANAIGTQRAQAGASGFSSTSGSAADVQASTAQNAEENASRITYNTMLKQWGLQNEINSYNAQISNVQNAQSNSQLSTLLTGATSLYKQYNAWNKVGG